ncbi:phage head morphogenesis protein [Flavobacterium suncheonense]|uniref:phage head morphogenesis protein n=1 Tax=Flavobacterium suncheonense TaxID=350894 RepID=UPI00041706C0|nr:phage head morphogenesis protein [Flavobacterium suncheonense]
MNLSAGDSFKQLLNAAEKAFKQLHKNKGYKPEDLAKEKAYKDLIDKTYGVFDSAITDNVVDGELLRALQEDTFLFSGLKTHAQLNEASRLLLDDEGKIKSWEAFSKDFENINSNYNQNYLEAEYQYAVGASLMAGKWSEFGESDRYNLQYRTAGDARVRQEHEKLHNTTLPKNDPFWDSYYPPNGWRCRCTVVEVLKDKYEQSDSGKSIKAGEAATSQIGKDGKNRLEIFRFNPGKQKIIFPPKHPYRLGIGNKEVTKVIKDVYKNNNSINLSDFIKGGIPTNKEIKAIFQKYAQLYPDDFRNGLEDVKFLKSTGYLMQHSMKYSPATGKWVGGSTLSLSSHTFSSIDFNPLESFKTALGAIKKGEKLSFKQEYALESMWHEILHAKTKTAPVKLSPVGTKNMETINQFCARHTYPEFMERLGGKATHQKDILENGYGYREWISDFRQNLKEKGISEDKALNFFMPHLMQNYSTIGGKIREFFEENTK